MYRGGAAHGRRARLSAGERVCVGGCALCVGLPRHSLNDQGGAKAMKGGAWCVQKSSFATGSTCMARDGSSFIHRGARICAAGGFKCKMMGVGLSTKVKEEGWGAGNKMRGRMRHWRRLSLAKLETVGGACPRQFVGGLGGQQRGGGLRFLGTQPCAARYPARCRPSTPAPACAARGGSGRKWRPASPTGARWLPGTAGRAGSARRWRASGPRTCCREGVRGRGGVRP